MTATQGSQVCLGVTANNFTNINGVQLSIAYNPSILSFSSIGSINLAGLTAANFGTSTPGVITLSWIDAELDGTTVPNGTQLFTLCFNVVGNATSQVSFSNTPTPIEIINTADQNVQASTVNGTVTVGSSPPPPPPSNAFTLTVGSAMSSPGNQVCLGVTTNNFTNINGLQFSVSYNASALTFASVGSLNLPGLTASNFGTSTAGIITMSWVDPELNGHTVPNGTQLFTLCFNVVGSSTTTVSFSNTPTPIEVINTNDENLNAVTVNGTVTVGGGGGNNNPFTLSMESATAQQGAQVCLDVTATGFTNINGVQFSIQYNSSSLTFQGIQSFNLPGLSAVNFGTATPGIITMSWTDAELDGHTVSNGTRLFEICFTQNSCNGSSVSFSNTPTAIEVVNAMDQMLPVTTTNGMVSADCGSGTFTLDIEDINTACPGTQICLDVTATNFTNINGVQFTIGYNPAHLTYSSVGDFVLPGLTAANFGTGNGTITFSWTDPELNGHSLPATPAQRLFEICFTVVSAPTSLSFTNTPTSIEVVNTNDQNVQVATNMGMVTCNQSAPFTISNAQVQNVSCAGQNTGSISLTVSGGTGPYTYTWSPNVGTGSTVSQLAPGTYSVTVTNTPTGQTTTGQYVVTSPPAITIMGTVVPVTAGNTGSIAVTVSGGTPGYTYLWNNGSTSSSISNLAQGTYCVSVTDQQTCIATNCFVVPGPAPVAITNAQIQNVRCSGQNTGSIALVITGGSGQFTYNWLPNVGNTATVTQLAAGTYAVTVVDMSNGQTATGQYVVASAPPITVTPTITASTTGTNGSIALTVTGGTPGFTYVWNTGATTSSISNLAPGSFCVTITDQQNCTRTSCFTVPSAPLAFSSVTTDAETCVGLSNGRITINVAGGVAPYSLTAQPGNINLESTTGSFVISPLTPGTYSLIITDAANGTLTRNETVGAAAAITVVPTVINDTEDSGCVGSISLNISGGAPGYVVNWNVPGLVGPQIIFLCEGNYVPTIRDANGCEITGSPISVNTFGQSTEQRVDAICAGDNNGSITVNGSGGQAPYQYAWRSSSGGAVLSTSPTLSNVAAGNYILTLTDAVGLSIVRTYTIGTQSNFMVAASVLSDYNGFDVSCADASNGRLSAVVTTSPGTTGFTYRWERNGNLVGQTAELNGIVAGTYRLIVTDALTCSQETEVELVAPNPISIIGTVTGISCVGTGDGEIIVQATGGVPLPNYLFSWNGGQTGNIRRFLPVGSYEVTVTDANGCQETASFAVTQPQPMEVEVETESATDNCNGTVRAIVTGGTAPFTFNWMNIPGAPNAELVTDLCPGDYFLTVRDSRGCITTVVSGSVLDRRYPCLEERVVITPDGNGSNDNFIVFCIDELVDNHLEVYNRWGQLVFETDNYNNDWEGVTNNGDPLAPGPYYYILEYNGPAGERLQYRGSMTIIRD